jgi:hypothetical protein
MAAAAHVNPALMAKLPLEFKQLGLSIHKTSLRAYCCTECGAPVIHSDRIVFDYFMAGMFLSLGWRLMGECRCLVL